MTTAPATARYSPVDKSAVGRLRYRRATPRSGTRSVAQSRAHALAGDRSIAGARRAIENLPSSYQADKARSRRSKLLDFAIDTRGALDFILQNFQFRYVTTHDYLLEYSRGPRRTIDLMVAHIVDYDWPIGRGVQTITPLAQQSQVMERITILTGGRIHYFAPFCPFKETAYQLGLSDQSSLALAKDAVENHGAIGIKLYPPMGFAPIGNTNVSPSMWVDTPLDPRMQRDDIGTLLNGKGLRE